MIIIIIPENTDFIDYCIYYILLYISCWW